MWHGIKTDFQIVHLADRSPIGNKGANSPWPNSIARYVSGRSIRSEHVV